jgi:hypothetical protein
MALTNEKQYNTFVKGFITEASALIFPENASLDEDNFTLERDGSRSRRLGLNYEPGHLLKDTGLDPVILESARTGFYRWDTTSEGFSKSIGVIRVYNRLWFIDLLDEAPSSAFLNGGNFITIAGLENNDIDAAVVNSNLILVSQDIAEPISLSYDNVIDFVFQDTIPIEIRDFWGVDDGYGITDRLATITPEHRYNLVNQGWSSSVQAGNGGTAYAGNAIDVTRTQIGVYPSNADVWYLAREERPDQSQYNKYRPQVLIRNNTLNALASKGATIINAFTRGNSRETSSGVLSLPLDRELGSFTTVASYGSRVFYSGISSSVLDGDDYSPNYNGIIFFSQLVTNKNKLGKCYQEADPTAEDISDIIDTDGGTIQIPEITKVVKLYAAKGSLIIFAENGIWELFSEGKGFTATGFQLSKLSSTGVVNKNAIIETNGAFLCFSVAGIFSITEDDVTSRYRVENISLNTIQTYYNSLSEIAKTNAKAFFDEKENKVRWLYNDVDSNSFSFNRELILDITLGAFSKNSFSSLPSNTPIITDYIPYVGYSVSEIDTAVYVQNDAVIVTNNDAVVVTEQENFTRGSQFGFLTMVGTSFTISKYNNTRFVDWEIAGGGSGTNYGSFLLTGYELFGDTTRNKQTPYAFFFFDRTESGFSEVDGNLELDNPSACWVQAQWNWTNSANSGKWGTPFKAYRLKRNYIPTGAGDSFDYGEKVIVTKNKLRGTGKSISLNIYSEPGKDIKLLGWSLRYTADEVA